MEENPGHKKKTWHLPPCQIYQEIMKNYQPKTIHDYTGNPGNPFKMNIHYPYICIVESPPKWVVLKDFPPKFGGYDLIADCPPKKMPGKLYVPNFSWVWLPGQPIGRLGRLGHHALPGGVKGRLSPGSWKTREKWLFFSFTGKNGDKMFTVYLQIHECLTFWMGSIRRYIYNICINTVYVYILDLRHFNAWNKNLQNGWIWCLMFIPWDPNPEKNHIKHIQVFHWETVEVIFLFLPGRHKESFLYFRLILGASSWWKF